ncbi:hypothetical protein FACS1894116_04620 [Betaproteobacteria bacterium]|nr:hypothetical protein FACS1894116_04620 [Betaproteobacteria bacterium]GHU01259.1 hypothetical protein FACS1894154_11140 [Betaproteobacteria bacterium]GHU29225.1 hypothetical protein FACS189497_06760 [Betaproteobacteria bacterium]
MKYKHIACTLGAFAFLLTPLSAWAGDIPPAGSKPLSEILKAVEQQKLGVISEGEFDDGFWEVKVCDALTCQKLYIDPKSGTEQRRRKTDPDEINPTGAMPLSTIVQSIEARGLGIITEVEFDDGYLKIELRKDGESTKLVLDPRTGAPR